MEDITRRGFMEAAGTMGVMGAAAAGLASLAGGAAAKQAQADEAAADAPTSGWLGTPVEKLMVGNSDMPLAELNRRRREYVDAQTEYTMADGTVVPEVFVKVHALISTYGWGGWGRTPTDNMFKGILYSFDENQAQAFLDMPWGEKFTAYDLHAITGREIEECTEICDHLASEGYLDRYEYFDAVTYNQVPWVVGIAEYQIDKISDQHGFDAGSGDINEVVEDFLMCGTPCEYTLPLNQDVVADEGILPYDDAEEIIKSKSLFSIAPCYCRFKALAESGEDYPPIEDFVAGQCEDYMSPLNGQRVETCLMFGNAAHYWISRGIAREITKEQALEYLQRSRDDGFILQSLYDKDTEAICSCHGDSCLIFKLWRALDPATTAQSPAFSQVSHYQLDVDFDKCIQCGACEARCPVHCITMDEETGYPQVNEICVRCGQCAYVCPAEARKLSARPAELNAELPDDLIADHNMKAAYRFETGVLG